MFSMLGAIFNSGGLCEYQYLEPIVRFLDGIIIPFTVVLAIAAAVMILVFAILIAKAEDAERSKEMKRRLIGLMVTVVIVVIVVWVFGYIISNFGTIMDFFRNGLGLFNFGD